MCRAGAEPSAGATNSAPGASATVADQKATRVPSGAKVAFQFTPRPPSIERRPVPSASATQTSVPSSKAINPFAAGPNGGGSRFCDPARRAATTSSSTSSAAAAA
jgi:hypothetical protein